jgi:Ca-activated chloride channel family protein
MTFAHPVLLASIPPICGVLALAFKTRVRRVRQMEAYLNGHSGAEFWPQLHPSPSLGGRWRIRGLLVVLSGSLLGVALAQPQAGSRAVPILTPVEPLILVLDISRSMGVGDVPLGRLNAARLLARRIVGEAGAAPVGLVVFAGEAYGILSPSTDRELLFGYMDVANPDLLTQQGTELAPALESAMEMGEEGGYGVLLLSDGEGHGEADEVLRLAEEIRNNGGWISAISLGTESGGLVPTTGSLSASLRIGALRAETEGGVPLSQARPAFLAEVAKAGGGVFAQGITPAELSSLLGWVGGWVVDQEVGVEVTDVPVEAWSWFLALAIGGLMLELALESLPSRKDEVPCS